VRADGDVLHVLTEWARSDDNVRAALLTGSRADPDRRIDFLSDYDVEVYVTDVDPFGRSDESLEAFGRIMARWPHRPRGTLRDDGITRLVLFRDGVRIDFQILPVAALPVTIGDVAFRVLVDKDGLAERLSPLPASARAVARPTEDEYETLVYEFWWNAHYVPKALWRDELPFAASMMSEAVRDRYLRTVLEWFVAVQSGGPVNLGVRGRWLKRHLDEETWAAYEATFSGADVTAQWEAFFRAVDLFRWLAQAVGERLGYRYPEQIDREMSDYFERIRAHPRADGIL